MSSKKVNLHAVFNHGGVGPGLVEICANGIGTISTDDNAAHATLIEGFCDLAKVIFGMLRVGVNDVGYSTMFNGYSTPSIAFTPP